ncbi:cytochrome B [Pseudomonas agarici]|uniref:Cytochrome B n=1 Tax=Pseudomonas agarici TaxID=46677 RepID=A0A0X1SY67_PSEAA|nr:cytochrome b [Pseudomonas agarici]AMB84783.1 cytochrome B [Pseudomonas agarici]NWC09944.1 cytochrome b [Pseudomonas agarici]SEL56216.1 cytochrome b561 [Pseudomonas agarici]
MYTVSLPLGNSPTRRHDRLTIGLHWLTALLVIYLFASSQIWAQLERGTPLRKDLQSLHISCGILLALIVLTRITWRLFAARRLPAQQRGAMDGPAKLAHWALYGLLLTQICLGFAFRWAQGEPFRFFGLMDIPTLVSLDRSLRPLLSGLHEQVAWIIVILAGLHAIMALVHHYVLGDDTLRRMLPGTRLK